MRKKCGCEADKNLDENSKEKLMAEVRVRRSEEFRHKLHGLLDELEFEITRRKSYILAREQQIDGLKKLQEEILDLYEKGEEAFFIEKTRIEGTIKQSQQYP